MKSRIVLFGGTFDPVHNAHLAIARAAADRFDPEKIIFIPAANPPHKAAETVVAGYEDRVRMAEIACAPEPRFEVSRIEAGPDRSYSIDTIERMEATGFAPMAFLIGSDALAEIETWHRWRDVVRAVEFIVVLRPGSECRVPPGATVYELGGLDLPVSSSAIRDKLRDGDFDVPVPEAVIRYIRERGLYRGA
jgi:nicotinate-nucleotide adenylyltransferase